MTSQTHTLPTRASSTRLRVPRFLRAIDGPRFWRAVLFILIVLLVTAIPARAQSSLFADPKANDRGDLLTIVLAERTAAQRQSDWENQAGATASGGAAATRGDVAGKFGLDATFNKEAMSRNGSRQSDLLSGTMTAQVVAVDSTGNLVIHGERKLNVNGESHLLRVSGLVRPFDVRYDNSVLSYQIANADIEYRRDGFGRKLFRPGVLARAGLAVVTGVAVAFLLQK